MKKGLLESVDYNKVNKNLEAMFQHQKAKEEEVTVDNACGPLLDVSVLDEFRYQNVIKESYGYVGRSVDVRPYGIAKFKFVAQFDNELSLNQGNFFWTHIWKL